MTWLIVAGLAIAGFAAFSPRPAPSPAGGVPSTIASLEGRGFAAGRVLAVAFAVGIRSIGPIEMGVASGTSTVLPDPILSLPSVTKAFPATAAHSEPVTAGPPEPTPTTLVAEPTVAPGEYQWRNGSTCYASWYGPGLEDTPTASGEPFDPDGLTGAIHDVPFGTLVLVTRIDTGASVMVRINDRGPFIWDDGWRRHPTRCIDLSPAAMEAIEGTGDAVIEVTINY